MRKLRHGEVFWRFKCGVRIGESVLLPAARLLEPRPGISTLCPLLCAGCLHLQCWCQEASGEPVQDISAQLWSKGQSGGRLQQVGDRTCGECLCVPHVWHSRHLYSLKLGWKNRMPWLWITPTLHVLLILMFSHLDGDDRRLLSRSGRCNEQRWLSLTTV